MKKKIEFEEVDVDIASRYIPESYPGSGFFLANKEELVVVSGGAVYGMGFVNFGGIQDLMESQNKEEVQEDTTDKKRTVTEDFALKMIAVIRGKEPFKDIHNAD